MTVLCLIWGILAIAGVVLCAMAAVLGFIRLVAGGGVL